MTTRPFRSRFSPAPSVPTHKSPFSSSNSARTRLLDSPFLVVIVENLPSFSRFKPPPAVPIQTLPSRPCRIEVA